MEWEKDAKEVVDNIPTPEIMKNMTILYAEKLARKNKKKKVSMDEVVQTRDSLQFRHTFPKVNRLLITRRQYVLGIVCGTACLDP